MARIQTPNPGLHLPFHLLLHLTLLFVYFWLLCNTGRPLLAAI